MKIDVIMPKLGESVTEGDIVKWWKRPGETVTKDETLLEVSTDKVDSEVPSPVSGEIAELLANEGDTVAVGDVIARIAAESQKVSAHPTPSKAVTPSSAKTSSQEKTAQRKSLAEKSTRFYSPLVMSIARQENVSGDELEKVPGSGIGGRVTKKDMLKYLASRSEATSVKIMQPPFEKELLTSPQPISGENIKIVPMDSVRRKISHHMRKSLDTSAHVYVVSECDVSKIVELIKKNGTAFARQEGFKLTFTPFVLEATMHALLEYPLLNSSVDGDQIIYKRFINLGMAVASTRGLLVPVIKNAEEKNFRGLARTANDLAVRTRNNQLVPQDVENSTFSVTNFGVFGNIMGFPIINQPNVGILGVGAIKKRPKVIDTDTGDAIAIRSLMNVTLSFDHRVVDGDVGGKFLQSIVYYLENFTKAI